MGLDCAHIVMDPLYKVGEEEGGMTTGEYPDHAFVWLGVHRCRYGSSQYTNGSKAKEQEKPNWRNPDLIFAIRSKGTQTSTTTQHCLLPIGSFPSTLSDNRPRSSPMVFEERVSELKLREIVCPVSVEII